MTSWVPWISLAIAAISLTISGFVAFDNWNHRRKAEKENRKPRIEIRSVPLANTPGVWTCTLIVQNYDRYPMLLARIRLMEAQDFHLHECKRVDIGAGYYTYAMDSARPVEALTPDLQIAPRDGAPVNEGGKLRPGSIGTFPFFLSVTGPKHPDRIATEVTFKVRTRVLADSGTYQELLVPVPIAPRVLWEASRAHRAPSDI